MTVMAANVFQSRRWVFGTLLLAAAVGGCTPTKTSQGVRPDDRFTQGAADDVVVPAGPTLSNTDPCAMRLHDLCGALLMYAFEHGGTPQRLEDLTSLPGADPLSFVCPESKKPYVYSYEGIRIPSRKARVIIYDPEPSHSGVRWAVVLEEPQPDKPIVTDVRYFPESFFTLRPPTP